MRIRNDKMGMAYLLFFESKYLGNNLMVAQLSSPKIVLRLIYTIRFVAYNSYSGTWKRALMSYFYSFDDGEI